MIFFVGILAVPLLIALLAKLLSKDICWKEFAVMLAVQVVVAGAAAGICYYQTYADTEILNSSVVSKYKEKVSCSHSYSCHCRQSCSGSGKSRSCHEVCDTCYEHSHDFDWAVYSGIGNRFEINRIDRQGNKEPPRFTAVRIGEPTSVTHSYNNYVKAAPDTLFRKQGQTETYKGLIPAYPIDVYDYYRLNRLVLVNGAAVADPNYWNADSSQLNAEVGSAKQTNAIVVITKNMAPDYFYALEQEWVGGKKNDVVLVVNLDDGKKPTWANVMSWESNELFKVKVRDDIMARTTVERWDVIDVLKKNILQYHQRKPMADFEYLTATITPTATQWIVTIIIGGLISVALSIFFHKNEVFPEYRGSYSGRYGRY